MTDPVGPKSKFSSHLIYERIRQKILDFEFYPSSRLTETELASQFEVSRTPIRAALQRLEAEGFIRILPKQGCFVRPLDIETVSHYYDVRIALESSSVELACDHMSNEDLDALADIWNPEYLEAELDMDEIKAEEEAFHISIALGAGNPVLADYLRDINNHIRIIRRLGFPDRQSVIDTCIEHSEILELIRRRNKTDAKRQMQVHIRKSQELARSVTLHQLQHAARSAF